MTGAALDACNWNMRRRPHSRCGRAVVTGRAINVLGLMGVNRARKGDEALVAGLARQIGRDMRRRLSERSDIIVT